MMNEKWVDVKGHEGSYRVSNHGRVKSISRIVKDIMPYGERNRIISGKIIKGEILENGYRYVSLSKNGEHQKHKVSRLVAIHFIDNSERKPQVNHKDGEKDNNYAGNLEWCTALENERHAFENGLKPKGESCGKSKLTKKDVLNIRHLYETASISYSALSKKFDVTVPNIGAIINRKTWKHI